MNNKSRNNIFRSNNIRYENKTYTYIKYGIIIFIIFIIIIIILRYITRKILTINKNHINLEKQDYSNEFILEAKHFTLPKMVMIIVYLFGYI